MALNGADGESPQPPHENSCHPIVDTPAYALERSSSPEPPRRARLPGLPELGPPRALLRALHQLPGAQAAEPAPAAERRQDRHRVEHGTNSLLSGAV